MGKQPFPDKDIAKKMTPLPGSNRLAVLSTGYQFVFFMEKTGTNHMEY